MGEVRLVERDARPAVGAELVEEGLGHHRGGLPAALRPALREAKLRARRVAAVAWEDRVADARQVRRLGEVVTAAARPDEHVVGQVAREGVRLLLRCGEDAAERRDVLVVPPAARWCAEVTCGGGNVSVEVTC